ncbi:hypothetical protein TWF481_000397 [Arthrobotrys musiformis]|uniref:Nucleoside phosphorylase domain-containing protein n=1 Tax=Arthrobotrys musiformis TaxID=47236 RepID=A0AAV9WPG5_9PEZI
MSSRPNRDYTIGWICALPLEMAAARMMLDEDHGIPQEQHGSDHNIYHLGSIGKHNIVIACLPAGVYGTTPAATVAAQMLSSFESIRFGLLVGIGGGIPSRKHDIRLGDIVVSQPVDSHGGVVQYDRGRSTGSLNKPPLILLNALSSLQSDHELHENRIPEILSTKLASRSKRVQRAYSHQGILNDNLYLTAYEHHVAEANSTSIRTCELCDATQRITRLDRSTVNPVIHYGVIGSGNKAINDSSIRDSLGEELGVICLEIEAAGLMDNFPCLVIKGICDYADSHRHKIWQRYAAATAAAYTKELLDVIPAKDVAPTAPVSTIIGILNQVQNNSERAEYERLLDKIPLAEGATFDSNTQSYHSKCLRGTRVELIDEIHNWLNKDTGSEVIFWLNGMAGTGKSTIARTIAESLTDDYQLGASFFFNRNEEYRSNPRRVFTTIAFQLARSIPNLGGFVTKAIQADPMIIMSTSTQK